MMKRFVGILLFVALASGIGLFADESVLIDFNDLTADYTNNDLAENSATMIDYSVVAGSSFTDEDKARMKTSLFIENWEVVLNSSARSVNNQALSFTRVANIEQSARQFAGEVALGVRVHFPNEPYNAWALIRPPFEIPAYADKTDINGDELVVPAEEVGLGNKYNGLGVLKNVGILKSISVNVYGRNFPNGFAIILQDQNNVQNEYFLGYLNFDGWRTLTWNNPNYIQEVRNREIKTYPLYPNSVPSIKLIGFRIYKDSAAIGGDIVTYIKDVTVTYDKAVLELQSDINEEAIWGILSEREQNRRNAELSRLGNLQVLRYLESQKQHQAENAE